MLAHILVGQPIAQPVAGYAEDVDVVVSAIVGSAGLRGTWAALESGKTVALANKESLVVGGPLVMELARRTGARLLPVVSARLCSLPQSHSNLGWRCLPRRRRRERIESNDKGGAGMLRLFGCICKACGASANCACICRCSAGIASSPRCGYSMDSVPMAV